ncbi:MAG: hypothetical protein ACI835_003449 [Planctomycetota bacterium]
MSTKKTTTVTSEKTLEPSSAWVVMVLQLVCVIGYPILVAFTSLRETPTVAVPILLLLIVLNIWTLIGYYVVEPNMARVMVFFGTYRGTVRENGFFWTNSFTLKKKVSLRSHNLDSDMLKVNDSLGNPVEISAVIVWAVNETARATFDVEDYEHYVRVQSDAAVRQLATSHPYDNSSGTDESITLRGSTDLVAGELEVGLRARLASAGIEVVEARLNHLAYAPEIASAMLQRQQAKAIVDARHLIVEGAVGMVDMALNQLSDKNILELDDERRATLVGNLLVVLCAQSSPTPVVNTGSLYN